MGTVVVGPQRRTHYMQNELLLGSIGQFKTFTGSTLRIPTPPHASKLESCCEVASFVSKILLVGPWVESRSVRVSDSQLFIKSNHRKVFFD